VSSKQLETVKLTARFKLDECMDESLFETYRSIVNELLGYAHSKGITSFKKLRSEKYYELRQRYPKLPSHYIYTACQMACSIYKSFKKLRRKGKLGTDKPLFKKHVIMLDDHLFKLDLEKRIIKISTPNGRVALRFYPAKYHEKFREWRVGQAWLVETPKGIFVNVVFSREVEIREPRNFVGVDLNENNVTLAFPDGFVQIITHEREIRTGYFVKRRRIQRKLKIGGWRKELLEKYGKRERNRLNDLYHKLANKIVKLAEKYGGIALEDLTNIRDSIKHSAEINGRLHRWSFRKLQSIIEYKAKLKGIKVVFVNPNHTSSLCPICGRKLKPEWAQGFKV